MAKTSHARALVPFHRPAPPPVIVVNSGGGRGGKVRRAARRAGHAVVHHGKRGARAVGRGAKRSLPVLGLALGGAFLGYAESKKWLDRLPAIGGSRALPIALAGWAATRFSKNPHIRMAGVAAIVAGSFDWGKTQGSGAPATHGIFGVSEGGAGSGGGF